MSTIETTIQPKAVVKKGSGPKKDAAMLPVLILAIFLMLLGVSVILFRKGLDVDVSFAVLLVSVSLALSCSLILFYFLSSSAQVTTKAYKLGGAVAGFVVLFTTFYNLTDKIAAAENDLYRAAKSGDVRRFTSLVNDYAAAQASKNTTLEGLSTDALVSASTTMHGLANGQFQTSPDDLPRYLLPMIEKAKTSWYATQLVIPETFWKAKWSNKYFDENVQAVKRGVDLKRIFIIDPNQTEQQKKFLSALIKKHLEHHLNIRILEKAEYSEPNELRDLLVADGGLTGWLVLNNYGFQSVYFSVDPSDIRSNQALFDRWWENSESYDDWMKDHTEVAPHPG